MDCLNFDTLGLIKNFVGDAEYVHMAPLSKDWNGVWGTDPKETRAINKFTTVGQLKLFIKAREPTKRLNLTADVAAAGRLDILKCLKGKAVFDYNEIVRVATFSQRVHILKWIKHGCLKEADGIGGDGITEREFFLAAFVSASYCGRVNMIKWLYDNGGVSDKGVSRKELFAAACCAGASGGNWEFVESLMATGASFYEGPHVDDTDDISINWREGHEPSWQVKTCLAAARDIALNIFKDCCVRFQCHLSDPDFDDYQMVSEYAARGGHLELLKYAFDNECILDEFICTSAAGSGQLEVLKEEGCLRDNLVFGGQRVERYTNGLT